MNWQSKIKLLCWDLDGTLYPSNPEFSNHIEGLIVDAVALKNNWSKEIAVKKIAEKFSQLGSKTKTMSALGVDGSNFFTGTWDTINFSLYIEKNPKLAQKIAETKLKNSMFTNSNTLKNVYSKLSEIGIDPKNFSFIMTSTIAGFTKPDPRVFEAIIKKSGLKPEEILYIGDRDSVDIIPAKKLGIKTCIVRTTSEHADLIAKDPMEVLELFEKLNKKN